MIFSIFVLFVLKALKNIIKYYTNLKYHFHLIYTVVIFYIRRLNIYNFYSVNITFYLINIESVIIYHEYLHL